MRHNQIKALMLMLEAHILCQIQGEKSRVLTLIDEAWKEFDRKEKATLLGGPKRG